MKEIVIKTKNLTKKYSRFTAVNNVNMEIKQGEIYGLVGKNGAGKTTLLRMISGLTMPSNGEIQIFDETSEAGLNRARKRTGTIIETPSFFPYLSAGKNLEYYRIQRGIVEKDVVEDVLKFVGLTEVGKKKFKNFSLGMKQRLGMALAIMANPDLLILDEPINGLDPTGIVKVRDILLKLNKERNTTIIISSHILSELSQLATTYGFIHEGEFLEQICAGDIKEKCKNYLSIRVDNTAKAAALIENKLKCSKYEVLNDNELRLYEMIDKPEIISMEIVNNGIMLYSICQMGSNLEDYFINLIGGYKND